MTFNVLPPLRAAVATLLGIATLTACAAAPIKQLEKPMKWMEHPQTLCIARFVLTMPVDFTLLTQAYNYNDDDIETMPKVKLHMFNHAVQEREKELTDKKRVDTYTDRFKNIPTNVPWLEKAISPQPNSRLLIFKDYENGRDGSLFKTEGYIWSGDTQFLLKSSVASDRIPVAVTHYTEQFSRVRARPNNEIPTEPGYCFDRGIMVGGKKFYETASASYHRPDTPGGVVLSIDIRPTNKLDTDTLLDRVPDTEKSMGKQISHVRTLRKDKRTQAGLDGQEYAIQINAEGKTGYLFTWEAQGKLSEDLGPGSTLQPHTTIELRIGIEGNAKSGKDEGTELTEEEAVALWEAILNSFQARPGAV